MRKSLDDGFQLAWALWTRQLGTALSGGGPLSIKYWESARGVGWGSLVVDDSRARADWGGGKAPGLYGNWMHGWIHLASDLSRWALHDCSGAVVVLFGVAMQRDYAQR